MQLDDKVKQFCQKEYASLTNNQPLPVDKIISPMRKSSGQLQNGRWTREEHIRFVEGLSLYGKNWKQVEDYVGTRSGAQIRSHAQKFFNRLEREYAKKQTEQQQQELASQSNQKYNFRKRFSSFDSTASYDPVSEDQEEKVSNERLKQVVPQDNNSQKRDIKGWIKYYRDEQAKLFDIIEDPEKKSKQHEDNLQKIKGIIQLLSAYENIQDMSQQPNIQQQSQQQQSNSNSKGNLDSKEQSPQSDLDIGSSSSKQQQKQPQVITLTTSPFMKMQAQQNLLQQFKENEGDIVGNNNGNISIEQQILSQQTNNSSSKQNQDLFPAFNNQQQQQNKIAGISHDESFFHFVLKRYWNSINPSEQEKEIRLSQLVNLGNNEQDQNNQQQLQQPQQYTRKRKSSFALNENGTEEEKERKIEKLRKLVKPNNNQNSNLCNNQQQCSSNKNSKTQSFNELEPQSNENNNSHSYNNNGCSSKIQNLDDNDNNNQEQQQENQQEQQQKKISENYIQVINEEGQGIQQEQN